MSEIDLGIESWRISNLEIKASNHPKIPPNAIFNCHHTVWKLLKMSHWNFSIFVVEKLTYLVTLFYRQIRVFPDSPKLTILGSFNELLSTPNVNVARFARHVEWDFFCDFPALCAIFHAMKKLKWLLELERKFATSRFEVDTISLSKMLEKWTLRKLVSHFLSNSTFLPGSNSTFNYAIKFQLFPQSEWLPNHSFLLLKSVAKSS